MYCELKYAKLAFVTFVQLDEQVNMLGTAKEIVRAGAEVATVPRRRSLSTPLVVQLASPVPFTLTNATKNGTVCSPCGSGFLPAHVALRCSSMADSECQEHDLPSHRRRIVGRARLGAPAVLRLCFLAAVFLAHSGAVKEEHGENTARRQASMVKLRL